MAVEQHTDVNKFKSHRWFIVRDGKYQPATTDEIERTACFEVANDMALITGFKRS